MASSSRTCPPDRRSGGRWPALAQRKRAGRRARPGRRSRTCRSAAGPVSIEFVCSSTARGRVGVPAARLDEEAHHRAQRRRLDALAGDVADQHRHLAAGQLPDAVEVAAGGLARARARRAGRSRSPGSGGSDAGTKPSVSERAMRRSRWKSIALAIAAAEERASRATQLEVALVEAARLLVGDAQHAVQPRSELDRGVHQRARPSALGCHRTRAPRARHVPEGGVRERRGGTRAGPRRVERRDRAQVARAPRRAAPAPPASRPSGPRRARPRGRTRRPSSSELEISSAAWVSRSSSRAWRRSSSDQGGTLERHRREVGDHLGGAQVGAAQRPLGVERGHHERAVAVPALACAAGRRSPTRRGRCARSPGRARRRAPRRSRRAGRAPPPRRRGAAAAAAGRARARPAPARGGGRRARGCRRRRARRAARRPRTSRRSAATVPWAWSTVSSVTAATGSRART